MRGVSNRVSFLKPISQRLKLDRNIRKSVFGTSVAPIAMREASHWDERWETDERRTSAGVALHEDGFHNFEIDHCQLIMKKSACRFE